MLRLFGEKSWVVPEPFLSYYSSWIRHVRFLRCQERAKISSNIIKSNKTINFKKRSLNMNGIVFLIMLTSMLNVALFATGKAVSPPSSTSFKKYSTVMYLQKRKTNKALHVF